MQSAWGSPRADMYRVFIDTPRWLFLAALVFAPWAYGCTRFWALNILRITMALILLLWLAGCIARRAKPAVPPLLLGTAAFLLLQGWWMIANAHYVYDSQNLQFVQISSLLNFAPGDVDTVFAVPAMFRLTGLLGMVCFVADLAQRPQWRRRLWQTIGFTGASLIVYGIYRRVEGSPEVTSGGTEIYTFFANYIYHANAGAFINLVFPPIAGLAFLAFQVPKAGFGRALWLPAALLCIAGAFVATSKAGMVITALLSVILVWWQWRFFMTQIRSVSSKLFIVYAALAIVATGAVISVGWQYAATEWGRMEGEMTNNGRLLVYGACTKMLPDSGAWGFGPGNFMITFPHYTGYLGNEIAGVWEFAHEDYLQTLIEWGWIGAAAWAALFFGGMVAGWRDYYRRSQRVSPDRIFLFTTLLALAGLALHALVDFPLQIASLQLYVATYLGLAWGSSAWKR